MCVNNAGNFVNLRSLSISIVDVVEVVLHIFYTVLCNTCNWKRTILMIEWEVFQSSNNFQDSGLVGQTLWRSNEFSSRLLTFNMERLQSPYHDKTCSPTRQWLQSRYNASKMQVALPHGCQTRETGALFYAGKLNHVFTSSCCGVHWYNMCHLFDFFSGSNSERKPHRWPWGDNTGDHCQVRIYVLLRVSL